MMPATVNGKRPRSAAVSTVTRTPAPCATRSPDSKVLKIPHDTLNEQVLLAAACVDETVRRDLLAKFPPDYFLGKGHADIWTVLGQLEARGLHYDSATIEHLSAGKVDGAYLEQLVATRPAVPPNLQHHVDALQWDHVRLDAALGPVETFLEALRDPTTDPAELRRFAELVATKFADAPAHQLDDFGFVDAAELAKPLAPINWLLRHFAVAPGRPTLLAGVAGDGKSWLMAQLVFDVARGAETTWGGLPLSTNGRALFIDYEQPREVTQLRLQRLAYSARIDLRELQGRLSVSSLPPLYLQDARSESALMKACEGVTVCGLDSLRASCPTEQENDSLFAQHLVKLTRVAAKTGCTFLVPAHEGKEGGNGPRRNGKSRVRGSTGIVGAVNAVINVVNNDNVLSLTQSKATIAQPGDLHRVCLVDEGEIDPNTKLTKGFRIVNADNPIDSVLDGAGAPRFEHSDPALAIAKRNVITTLDREGEVSQRKLILLTKGTSKDAVRVAIDDLAADGTITLRKGPKNSKLYSHQVPQ